MGTEKERGQGVPVRPPKRAEGGKGEGREGMVGWTADRGTREGGRAKRRSRGGGLGGVPSTRRKGKRDRKEKKGGGGEGNRGQMLLDWAELGGDALQ